MGFRIGWLHAPAQVVQKLASVKQLSDLHTNSLAQYILDDFIRNKYYECHIKRVLEENKRRRDGMNSALLENTPANIPLEWSVPEGGLYFWLKLPGSIPMTRFYEESVKNGVVFVPGHVCCLEEPLENYIRLNFTYPGMQQINEGVRKLMKTLKLLYEEPGPEMRPVNSFVPIL
jgi:DNA-binding transcriptional MocR family regulator